jgi:hypothetical protein
VVSSSAQIAAFGYATTGSNTFIGTETISGSLLTNADTLIFTGSIFTSGSISVVGGTITGSLFGTASAATSASYALTASYVSGAASTWDSISNKPSGIVSSSTQVLNYNVFATTGSNVFVGTQIITGSLIHGLEGNIATGDNSHAEGSITKAIGNYSHAEGDNTQAKGDYSHAEGQETIASGSYSHAEGYQTIALGNHQHVQGQYNATSSVPSAFIVGNGTDDNNRSNLIFAVGNEVQITGSLNVTQGITGSLFGTSSWANNAISSSYAVTASYIDGGFY